MCPPVASTPSPPTGQNHVVHGTLQSHRGVPLPRRKYPPAFHFLSGFPVKSISREYFISEPKNPALIIFPKTDSFPPGATLLIVHTSAQFIPHLVRPFCCCTQLQLGILFGKSSRGGTPAVYALSRALEPSTRLSAAAATQRCRPSIPFYFYRPAAAISGFVSV